MSEQTKESTEPHSLSSFSCAYVSQLETLSRETTEQLRSEPPIICSSVPEVGPKTGWEVELGGGFGRAEEQVGPQHTQAHCRTQSEQLQKGRDAAQENKPSSRLHLFKVNFKHKKKNLFLVKPWWTARENERALSVWGLMCRVPKSFPALCLWIH